MSGHIQLVDASSPLRNHTHLRLDLEDGRQLRFVDPRRFGFVDWLEPGAEITDPSLRTLGIEPLDPGLDKLMPTLLHDRRAPVKSLLLDQRLVAGVGNIYAWRRPSRRAARPCATSPAQTARPAISRSNSASMAAKVSRA